MRRRVAITGIGAVTAVGVGVKPFWQALCEGISGIGPITLFDASPYNCRIAGEVASFEPREFMSAKAAATISRFAQFGVAAARMAYEDAALASVPRASHFEVCFGSSTTAVREFQETIEQFARGGLGRLSPSVILESIGSAVTNRIATELGLAGQTMTLSSGCTSGLDVVQWACEQIRGGRAVGAVAGATDSPLSTSIHAAWSSLNLLSRWGGPPSQALRPFDEASTGTVLGEGAGAFVLEDLDHARARGARIYAEVLGHGGSSEGLDLRVVDPAGTSLQTAVREALHAARLDASDIDYVNTHGGGVPVHDRAETAAYRAVFNKHVYNIAISSTKPVTGNPFAAGGALQIVAGCLTLQEQFIPPTLNHASPDAACDLDYVPNQGRGARVNRLLVAARAIGPTHSAVVLGLPSEH